MCGIIGYAILAESTTIWTAYLGYAVLGGIGSGMDGENNNAVNYGSIYAFKALGGSFAGGVAALIMTGTLWDSASYNWPRGFFFGACLGLLAALTLIFLVRRPTAAEMEMAVRKSEEREAQKAKPAMA